MRILIFVGLKVAEIVGLVALGFALGLGLKWIKGVPWLAAVLLLVFLTLTVVLVAIVIVWPVVEANWRWAGRLAARLRSHP